MRLIDSDELMEKAGRYKFAVREDIYELIRRAPTIDPVKHGRWAGYYYPGSECVYCSCCREEYYEDDLLMGRNNYPKYCPNCGAKMDGGEE